jgi:hypothetical protein
MCDEHKNALHKFHRGGKTSNRTPAWPRNIHGILEVCLRPSQNTHSLPSPLTGAAMMNKAELPLFANPRFSRFSGSPQRWSIANFVASDPEVGLHSGNAIRWRIRHRSPSESSSSTQRCYHFQALGWLKSSLSLQPPFATELIEGNATLMEHKDAVTFPSRS